MLLRLGLVRSVALITASALFLSLVFTALATVLFGNLAQLPLDLTIATIIPLLVAPAASYGAMTLLYEVEASRVALQRAAMQDSLTDLYNRRFLMLQLDAEVERARRSASPLSVLMVDIDHFKAINDRHGHAVGDEVLRAVGALLKQLMRAYDLVARYGGEEFVVLLPGLPNTAALAAAERIRLAIESLHLDALKLGDGSYARITTSVGISELGPGDEDGTRVLGRADRALYLAKNRGRNRCESLPADLPAG